MISKEYYNDNGQIKYIIMSKWHDHNTNIVTKNSIICMTFEDIAELLLTNNRDKLNEILLDYLQFNKNIVDEICNDNFDNVNVRDNNIRKYYFELLKKSNECCYYCGVTIENNNGEIEHMTPLSRGGTNELSNLVISCKKCNREKRTKTVEEYREYLENNFLSELNKINQTDAYGMIFYGETL